MPVPQYNPNTDLYKILEKIYAIEDKFPGILKHEMFDFIQVIENGAKKYEMDNWLQPEGKRAKHKDTHDSMFHHLSESYSHIRKDRDSNLDPLLHLQCRAAMSYTRKQRGLS